MELSPEQNNAVAWLSLTDEELIRNSASLGLPGDLHPEPDEVNQGVAATPKQIKQARKAADDHARVHVSDSFVKRWIKANRKGG